MSIIQKRTVVQYRHSLLNITHALLGCHYAILVLIAKNGGTTLVISFTKSKYRVINSFFGHFRDSIWFAVCVCSVGTRERRTGHLHRFKI